MNSITQVPFQGGSFDDEDGPFYWQQLDSCAGFTVSDECPWRYEEMTLVTFRPDVCSNGEVKGCEELVSYARIANGESSKQTATF